jgi:hypothetical protein
VQELGEAKDEKLCKSFLELQEEMELWQWDSVKGNRWARWAKCLQLSGMQVEGHNVTEDDKEGVSWAEATRNAHSLRSQLQNMKWSEEQWQTRVWNDANQDKSTWMTGEQRHLLWAGEKAFRKYAMAFRKSGIDEQHAQQEPFKDLQKAPCFTFDTTRKEGQHNWETSLSGAPTSQPTGCGRGGTKDSTRLVGLG